MRSFVLVLFSLTALAGLSACGDDDGDPFDGGLTLADSGDSVDAGSPFDGGPTPDTGVTGDTGTPTPDSGGDRSWRRL